MSLSILICGLAERFESRRLLVNALESQRQQRAVEDCEILQLIDDGAMKIGVKRNQLLGMASGDFVAFIDDDDMVSADYIATVLGAIDDNPMADCVYLEGVITFDGCNPKKFIHSISCTGWYEKDGVYYRTPNHLNAIRRDHALAIGFPLINHGEDKSFSDRIKPLLRVEAPIRPGPIYMYRYSPSGSRSGT